MYLRNIDQGHFLLSDEINIPYVNEILVVLKYRT